MPDEQDVAVAQPAVQEAALPAHLNPQWFEQGAPVPAFIANNPNWMNVSGSVDDVVHVRMPDGSVQKTTSPIHLGRWLLEQHATITTAPQDAQDTRVNPFDIQAQQRATPATMVDERPQGGISGGN